MRKHILPFRRFKIEGSSMVSALPPYSSVVVWQWGAIREGDVIVFQKGGLTICKRAIRQEGDSWLVRGDNVNGSTDSLDFGLVHQSAIFGKIIFSY